MKTNYSERKIKHYIAVIVRGCVVGVVWAELESHLQATTILI